MSVELSDRAKHGHQATRQRVHDLFDEVVEFTPGEPLRLSAWLMSYEPEELGEVLCEEVASSLERCARAIKAPETSLPAAIENVLDHVVDAVHLMACVAQLSAKEVTRP